MARRRVWTLVVALLLLLALAFFGHLVLAGSSGNLQRTILGLQLPWSRESHLTATPTKTPALPQLPTSTPTPLGQLPASTDATEPTATPSLRQDPKPDPTSTPSATPLPSLPTDLLAIAEEHDIDPSGRFVIVDQQEQQMFVVDAGERLHTLPISTGDPAQNYHTPAWSGVIGQYWGSFSARGVWADDAWYLFELTGGGTILIHSAPYVLQDGQRVYQELDALGLYPASMGCIRLRPDDAEWFTRWQPQGVPIVILGWDAG